MRLPLGVEHALPGARRDEEGERRLHAQNPGREVEVCVADPVKASVPQLDVVVRGDRAAQRPTDGPAEAVWRSERSERRCRGAAESVLGSRSLTAPRRRPT